MSEEMVNIAVFTSAPEAAIARGKLAEAGIESMVSIDDAGGMIPSLQIGQGVRLYVNAEDADKAQALLEGAYADEDDD